MTGLRRVRPRLRLLALLLLGLGAVLLVASVAKPGGWWQGGEATVPRDGESHVVTLSEPGGDYAIWSDQSLVDPECVLADADGTSVGLRRVPVRDRVYVDTMGVAKPEASFLFTAPPSDSVTITCDSIRSTPVSTVDLGPAPHPLVVALLNWGAPLLGLGMLLLGLALLSVSLVQGQRGNPPSPQAR